MLTEHIEPTGTLLLPVSSSGFVKNISSREFPAQLIFKHEKKRKKTEVVPFDELQSLLFLLCLEGEKGNGEAGDRAALMRHFSASY